jgi:phthiocerol/phenolphthiocerol synthesis type-I polyketide synthase C
MITTLAARLRPGSATLGLIAASAINQDGRSSGLTAPNGPAQTQLINQVAEEARMDVHGEGVAFVAVHGTGTPLGDPIEVGALGQSLSRVPNQQLVAVGSVKACYGHTEGTAGLTGNYTAHSSLI